MKARYVLKIIISLFIGNVIGNLTYQKLNIYQYDTNSSTVYPN